MPCSAAIIAGFETRTWATMCGLYPHLINSNQHNRRRLSCFMTKWNVKENSCVLAREELRDVRTWKGSWMGEDWIEQYFNNFTLMLEKLIKSLLEACCHENSIFNESCEWKYFSFLSGSFWLLNLWSTRTANVPHYSGHIKQSSSTCEASSTQLLWNFIKLEASTQLQASPRWPTLQPSPLGNIPKHIMEWKLPFTTHGNFPCKIQFSHHGRSACAEKSLSFCWRERGATFYEISLQAGIYPQNWHEMLAVELMSTNGFRLFIDMHFAWKVARTTSVVMLFQFRLSLFPRLPARQQQITPFDFMMKSATMSRY